MRIRQKILYLYRKTANEVRGRYYYWRVELTATMYARRLGVFQEKAHSPLHDIVLHSKRFRLCVRTHK